MLVCHLNDKERSASWQEMVRDWTAIVRIDDFALAHEYGEFVQAIKGTSKNQLSKEFVLKLGPMRERV